MGLHGLLRDKYPMLAKNLNKQYVPTSLKVRIHDQLSKSYREISAVGLNR
jgi:hypothetical protein